MTKTTASCANCELHCLCGADDRESDPRERTIAALVDEVQSQRARIAALEELASAAVSSAATKSTKNNTAPRQNNKIG